MGIKDSSLWAREILSFLETAKNGSINGTAEANAMKQSNLSRTLKSLEEKLKCQLLERGYNGVRLTENGREVFKVACDLDKVIYKVKNFTISDKNVSGKIRLWTSDGLGTGTCLYEISEEAYRKAIVQNEQKVPGGTFDDGKTLYSLVKTAKKHLNETVGYAFCHVKSPSPVKAAMQKALCAEKARIKAENIKIDRANQKYARKCGSLARKLGLAFENVLAIGADEAKLKNFILSLAEARERLKEMDAQSAAEIKHELLSCGRARKKAAIDKLGIYIADADPNRLSFDELFV